MNMQECSARAEKFFSDYNEANGGKPKRDLQKFAAKREKFLAESAKALEEFNAQDPHTRGDAPAYVAGDPYELFALLDD